VKIKTGLKAGLTLITFSTQPSPAQLLRRWGWMVGTMVVGLSLAGGMALGTESRFVNVQEQVNTGNQRAGVTLQQQGGDRVMSIVSGWGTATIDGEAIPFEPGTVLHIPNGVPYSIEVEGGELAVKMEDMTTPKERSRED
jgi:mannose-6-phosphate isomerase-like protein (cupin superfamily)